MRARFQTTTNQVKPIPLQVPDDQFIGVVTCLAFKRTPIEARLERLDHDKHHLASAFWAWRAIAGFWQRKNGLRNGHDTLPVAGGSTIGLSVTDA